MYTFIHTFELKKRITYKDYDFLRRNLESPKTMAKETYNYYVSQYVAEGISIHLARCSPNEIKSGNSFENFILRLTINPARILDPGTYFPLKTEAQLQEALILLSEKIDQIFNYADTIHYTIDTFCLSRIDLTHDANNLPKNIKREILSILWRLPLSHGTSYNTNLLTMEGYDRSRSIDLHHEHQGYDFCIYDKEAACIDQEFPKNITEYYSGTLRVELRCFRTYIQQNAIASNSVSEIIMEFLRSAEQHISKAYHRSFPYDTSLCYLSKKLLRQYLDCCNLSSKKAGKMAYLIFTCHKNKKRNLDYCISLTCQSEKAKNNLLKYFAAHSISPIVPSDSSVPFLQSLDSLLGIRDTIPEEERIFHFAQRHTHKKEVFCNVRKLS